ncbi:MAG TPA: hypothetical protein VF253_03810, partial [Candidatus Limnocylindrales bacterium]
QVAANLAAITARSGRQVVLVDYDTSDGSVSRIFKLMDRTGVTDLVDASPADVSSRLVRVSPNLRVLPFGLSEDPDTVDADRAAKILQSLAEIADLVMINGGVLHMSAGALAWAQAADSAILVAVRDQARRDDVEYAAESLRLVGVEVAGTVLAERKRGLGRARSRRDDRERMRPVMPEARETRNEPIRPFRDVARASYQEPQPVNDFRSEPDRMREYRTEPEPMRDFRSEREPVRDLRSEPEPMTDFRPEPEPIREFRPEPVRDTYRIEPALSDDDTNGEPELEPAPEPAPTRPRTPTRRATRRRGDPQPNT